MNQVKIKLGFIHLPIEIDYRRQKIKNTALLNLMCKRN